MRETPNPQIDLARDKMKALGVDSKLTDLLYSAASPKEVSQRIPGSGCMIDAAQALCYTFQALYKQDPTVLERAKSALEPLLAQFDLPDTLIEDYLIKWGDLPDSKLEFEHGDQIDMPTIIKFGEAAEQVRLDIIRAYLES